MKTYADLKRIAIFLLIGFFDVLFCIIYLSFEQLPWIYLENYGAANSHRYFKLWGIAADPFGVDFQITDGLQAVF